MKSSVDIDRARTIIQGWYKDFCEFYGKSMEVLEIQAKGETDTGFYEVLNPSNGRTAKIYRSTVSDYETSGSIGIPGDLKTEIWDAFQDL
jgi:hypothetical protein